jgi:hypothetical protein
MRCIALSPSLRIFPLPFPSPPLSPPGYQQFQYRTVQSTAAVVLVACWMLLGLPLRCRACACTFETPCSAAGAPGRVD